MFGITTALPIEKGPSRSTLGLHPHGSNFKCGKVEDCILQGLHEVTPINGNNVTLEPR